MRGHRRALKYGYGRYDYETQKSARARARGEGDVRTQKKLSRQALKPPIMMTLTRFRATRLAMPRSAGPKSLCSACTTSGLVRYERKFRRELVQRPAMFCVRTRPRSSPGRRGPSPTATSRSLREPQTLIIHRLSERFETRRAKFRNQQCYVTASVTARDL